MPVHGERLAKTVITSSRVDVPCGGRHELQHPGRYEARRSAASVGGLYRRGELVERQSVATADAEHVAAGETVASVTRLNR